MTRHEFIDTLSSELKKRRIADACDIVEEYDEHFDFKLADGYSEQEIAARLGDPVKLAAQFEPAAPGEKRPAGKKALTVTGLVLLDIPAVLALIALAAFGLVLIAAAAAFGGAGVCLLARLDPSGLMPAMPYGSAVVLGLALLALCVLTAVGCVWYTAFLRQVARSYGRFHSNSIAGAEGRPTLPPLPMQPQLTPRRARGLRRTARVALILFAVLLVAGAVLSAILAGSPAFWHVWGWFAA